MVAAGSKVFGGLLLLADEIFCVRGFRGAGFLRGGGGDGWWW